MRLLFTLSLIWSLFLPVQAQAPTQEKVLRLYGYAYDLKTNAYLYTEVHEQRVKGEEWLGGTTTYLAPDGTPMGRKTLDFSRDPHIPVYKLVLNYNGYSEAITAVGARIEMAKQEDGKSALKRDDIARSDGMAADSGFHSYLRAHFDELMQGKTVDLRLVVAGNLDSFKFRARKIGETTFEGRPAVKIEVALNSMLSLIAEPLELIYEPKDRKLVEYRGVSNIHDPKTGKPYDARITYYSTPPADAPKLPPLD